MNPITKTGWAVIIITSAVATLILLSLLLNTVTQI